MSSPAATLESSVPSADYGQEQGDNLAAKYGTQHDSRELFEYLGPALAAVKAAQ